MSRPSNRTSPSTRAPGTVSCMRLRQRSSVDLPQPDGPMIAVTSPLRTPNVMSRTTRDAPKYASSDSIATEAEPGSRRESGRETDDEDESEEDERPRPGLPVPVVIGRCGIVVDLHG